MPPYEAWLAQAPEWARRYGRPLVGLCYAQSLDGSLTAERGRPLALSGPETHRLTHALRAAQDAILVGVGTVLADDPALTARRVGGPNPQPVILDGRLRTPLTARLVCGAARPAWIATTAEADPQRRAALQCAGAELLDLPAGPGGVDLAALLACLAGRGVHSLMVEGGAAVLTAFLAQGLADWVSITVAPLYVGGLRAPETRLERLPRLLAPVYETYGDDLVVWGKLREA